MPVEVSCDKIGLDPNAGCWVNFIGKEAGAIITAESSNLSGFGYLFVIRNLPDDYAMNCGDTVLTAEEIESYFSAA